MNEAKIKASIDSLVVMNNKYLSQMKDLAISIATKDSAIEDYIRDTIINNATGKITNVATVDSDTADSAYDQLRILYKRVQDNTATIKDLASKFEPVSLIGMDMHDFNVPLVLLNTYAKSISLSPTFLLSDVDNFILNAKSLNLDTISIPVQIEVTSLTSATASSGAVTDATNTKVLATISKVKAAKLGIMLEARPYIAGSFNNNSLWNPTDVPGWFLDWGNVMTDILVPMATEAGIPVLIIGSYFDLLEIPANKSRWGTMINNIKVNFPMVVSYKTKYWVTTADYNAKFSLDVFSQLGLFSDLDLIMISGYFELTGQDDPTVDALVASWTSSTKLGRNQPILAQLQGFNTTYNVPVMFGDFKYAARELTNGFPSVVASTSDLSIVVNGILKTAIWGGQNYLLQDGTHPAVLDDLAGKVIGDTTINPNKMQFGAGAALFAPNDSSIIECSLSGYGDSFTQNFNSANSTVPVIPQQIFSFNLIAIIERKFGTIPGAMDITSKIAWIKSNLSNIIFNWNGYGSAPNGNKAYFSVWNGSAWVAAGNHALASSSSLIEELAISDNLVNLIANGDFSNGTAGWSGNGCSTSTNVNEMDCTLTTLSSSSGIYKTNMPAISGNKYYIVGKINPKYANIVSFGFNGVAPKTSFTPVPNNWNTVSIISIANSASMIVTYYHNASSTYVAGDIIKFKEMMVIDLTAAFGAGNEPTQAWCDANLPFRPAPVLTGSSALLAIQSDGFVYTTAYTDADGTVTHDGITSSMIYTEDISISVNFNVHDDYDLLVPTTPRRDAGLCNPPVLIRHASPYGIANFYTGASMIVSQEAQDRAYQAFYRVFGQLPWFAGFNLTSESLDPTSPYYLIGNVAQATIAEFDFER